MKLKENVDLKVLEELGFRRRYSTYMKKCVGKYNDTTLYINMSKSSDNFRELHTYLWKINEVGLQTIKDLIEKGLVE